MYNSHSHSRGTPITLRSLIFRCKISDKGRDELLHVSPRGGALIHIIVSLWSPGRFHSGLAEQACTWDNGERYGEGGANLTTWRMKMRPGNAVPSRFIL